MKASRHGLKWWQTSAGRFGWACKRCPAPPAYVTTKDEVFAQWAEHKRSKLHADSCASREADSALIDDLFASLGLTGR